MNRVTALQMLDLMETSGFRRPLSIRWTIMQLQQERRTLRISFSCYDSLRERCDGDADCAEACVTIRALNRAIQILRHEMIRCERPVDFVPPPLGGLVEYERRTP